MPGRLRILYCDDQARFRERFLDRHATNFRVDLREDVSTVVPALLAMKRSELPDLLLLDLYHGVEPSSHDAAAERAEEAGAALAELDAAIRRAKPLVDRAWRPVAVDVAEEVRRHFPAHVLPIMIYSQKGLFFLDDEQMRRIEQAEIDWLLKDSERFSSVTEDLRIRRVVERAKASRRIPRDIQIAIWSVLVGSILTLAIQPLIG